MNWKGGRKVNSKGYVEIWCPDHPNAMKGGYVLEHILIAEKAIGKILRSGVEIHHVNEVRGDNGNANLVVCENHAYHHLLHRRMRILKAGGNPNTDKLCSDCKRVYPKGLFYSDRTKYDGLTAKCKACVLARSERTNKISNARRKQRNCCKP